MVKNRGELLQIIKINQLLEFEEDYNNNVVVILEYEGEYRALPVREVLGKQEVVIKPVEESFSHVGFLSGSTILGDGNATFILDIEFFFR
jgi:two-component system chemotaxis sensor kinase CheA